MGHGKEVRSTIDEEGRVEVRDYGRGIPLGKLMDCARKINTGAKYDSEAFKKIGRPERGRHQGGQRAAQLLRDPGVARRADQGDRVRPRRGDRGDEAAADATRTNGTRLAFELDRQIFKRVRSSSEQHVEKMLLLLRLPEPRAHPRTSTARSSARRTACWTCWSEEMEGEPLYPIDPPDRQGHRDRLHPHHRLAARSTTPSSTASTPRRAARTWRPSARRW